MYDNKVEINKIIVVQVDSVLNYPPTMRILDELCLLNKSVYLISTVTDENVKKSINKDIKIINVGTPYKYGASPIKKLALLNRIKRNIWNAIDKIYDDNTLIWVMSNITLKHMGKRLLKYRYNLHLFELVEDVYYIGKNALMRMGLKQYADNAYNVIVPEYNRAQITKVWLKLSRLPLIVKNKPMRNSFQRFNDVTHSEEANNILKQIETKKIVLYQGIVDKERPVNFIAEAIEEMDGFVFLVMTGSNVDLSKYKKTYKIPFVVPPYHLEITSHAYIGVLIYQPVYDSFTSPLNSIYCAPNKLYEYSQFGIPMIGNNIPGLYYTIESNNMGVCFNNMSKEEIKAAILKIDKQYQTMTVNVLNFFNKDNEHDDVINAL